MLFELKPTIWNENWKIVEPKKQICPKFSIDTFSNLFLAGDLSFDWNKKKLWKFWIFGFSKWKKKIEIASIPRTAATGTNFASPPLDEIFVENFCRKFRINRNLQKFFFSQHEKVMVDDTLTCTNKKLECLSFVSLSARCNMCTVRLGSYPLMERNQP